VVRRIQRQRARGESLRAIADSLNRDEVPTAQSDSFRSTGLEARLSSPALVERG
jgi:Recombinase